MSEGIKRAALALSALDLRDREWILENLDPMQRAQLESALTEMDDPLAAPVASPADAPPDIAPPGESSNARRRVVDAHAQDLLGALHAEPDWMVAAVCGICQWRWLPELMTLLGAERAERVQRYMRTQPDHSPAIATALVEAVSKRLAMGDAVFVNLGPEPPNRLLRSRGRLGASLSRLTSWLL